MGVCYSLYSSDGGTDSDYTATRERCPVALLRESLSSRASARPSYGRATMAVPGAGSSPAARPLVQRGRSASSTHRPGPESYLLAGPRSLDSAAAPESLEVLMMTESDGLRAERSRLRRDICRRLAWGRAQLETTILALSCGESPRLDFDFATLSADIQRLATLDRHLGKPAPLTVGGFLA